MLWPLLSPHGHQNSRDMMSVPVYNLWHMAQEINLGGTIYISSKRAAEITGYTQDYIGQLARGGSITAQRVSGLWYVVEESLRNYKAKADEFKPIPPPPPPAHEFESSIAFDGKDYVSAQRAAQITGYHQDYVGQLARSGKVLSRQIGARWFVDREDIIQHKKHNDALLAAVQAESVGLSKDAIPATVLAKEASLHFNYIQDQDENDALPGLESRPNDINNNDDISDESQSAAESSEINEIPIRVIRPSTMVKQPHPEEHFQQSLAVYRSFNRVRMFIAATAIGLITIGAGYLYIFQQNNVISAYRSLNAVVSSAAAHIPADTILESINMPDFVSKFLAKELYYRRDSF